MKNYTKKLAIALLFVSTTAAMNMEVENNDAEFSHLDERMDIEARFNIVLVNNEVKMLNEKTKSLIRASQIGSLSLSACIDFAANLARRRKESLQTLDNGIEKSKFIHILSKGTGRNFECMYEELLTQYEQLLNSLVKRSDALMDVQGDNPRGFLQIELQGMVDLYNKMCNSELPCITESVKAGYEELLKQISENLQ